MQYVVLCEAECPGSFKAFDSQGFPSGSDSKESACNAGDLGLIAKSKRSSGAGRNAGTLRKNAETMQSTLNYQ